jgi:hypothetical protein
MELAVVRYAMAHADDLASARIIVRALSCSEVTGSIPVSAAVGALNRLAEEIEAA